MVAGIYFLRDLLLLRLHAAAAQGALVVDAGACCSARVGALLSAFLDALTVVAVAVTVGVGLLRGLPPRRVRQAARRGARRDARRRRAWRCIATDLEQFRAFLRGLMMHGAVGTAIGGVMTQVGRAAEPADRRAGRLELRRVLPEGGAGVAAGRVRRPRDLLAASSASGCSATARGLPDAVRAVLRDHSEHMAAQGDAARPAGADRAGAGGGDPGVRRSRSTSPRSASSGWW